MRPLPQIERGSRFGRWTVVGPARVRRRAGGAPYILCRCDCGTERLVAEPTLRNGKSKSCGCRRHDNGTHHMTGKALYNSWSNMIQRCTNPKHPSYPRYGGRGVTVCDEWRHDGAAFVAWALANGFKPGMSIERIDNDRGYSPDNCRWATRGEQQRNRHNNHWLTFRGETKCITDWAVEMGTTLATILHRIRRWGSVERALTTPIKRKSGKCKKGHQVS